QSITTSCFGDGTTPTSGCEECAVLGDTTIASDGGSCAASYQACFGTDPMCTGGQPGCCTYSNCANACDLNGDGTFDWMELPCFCTPDTTNPNTCSATQTNTMTCLGALEANQAAFTAFMNFQTCVFDPTSGVCSTICM